MAIPRDPLYIWEAAVLSMGGWKRDGERERKRKRQGGRTGGRSKAATRSRGASVLFLPCLVHPSNFATLSQQGDKEVEELPFSLSFAVSRVRILFSGNVFAKKLFPESLMMYSSISMTIGRIAPRSVYQCQYLRCLIRCTRERVEEWDRKGWEICDQRGVYRFFKGHVSFTWSWNITE